MSGQQQIKDYLQRHKIGALFEELMGKIVVDLPDEPIRYLISKLQTRLERKSEKSEKPFLSKSVSGTAPLRVRSGSPERSKLAASFAGEKLAAEKDRQYNKPWLSSTKPVKSKPDVVDGNVTAKSALKLAEKSGKIDFSGFEDIFEDAASTKKPPVAASAANTAAVMTSAAVLGKPEEIHNPAFTRFQNSISNVIIINRVQDELSRFMSEEDVLSAEVPVSIRNISETVLPIFKDAFQRTNLASVSSAVMAVNRFVKGPKASAVNHKKKLAEAVTVIEEEKRMKERQLELSDDSGYDESPGRDSAVELLEDVELLRQEGARNVKASGYAIRHTPSVDVKVSICARCAKFLDGDMLPPTSPARVSFGQQPSSLKEVKEVDAMTLFSAGRTAPSPVPPLTRTSRHSGIEGFLESTIRSARRRSPSPGPFESDDEEFESVSQVTGPRHPVWQDDEDEEVTPRKGSHMLSKSVAVEKVERSPSHSGSGVTSKSLSKLPPSGGTPRNSSTGTPRNSSSGTPRNSSGVAASKQSSTSLRRNSLTLSDAKKNAPTNGSDQDDENIISSLTRNSNQWAVPDYDTDGSTVYVTGGAHSRTKNYKPRG